MATPRVAAGALIRNPAGQILLVKPTYKDGWDIPGGYVEPGESPGAACLRELKEEIGLTTKLGRLLVVDWAPLPSEGDKLLFIFDGGTMTDTEAATLTPDGEEIAEVQFHSSGSLYNQMPDRLARRLVLAATAASEERSIYAEHGAIPEPPREVTDHPRRV